MKVIEKDDWVNLIAPYHFANQYASPLKFSFNDWKDPSDPLGSLLEVLKFASIGPHFGVKPSVAAGQVYLESDMGRSQDTLLGAKATKSDIAAGNAKRLKTYEEFSEPMVSSVQAAGDLIEIVKETRPGVFLIRCYQWFFYKPGLQDDFERYWRYYERREPDREKWLKATPEEYLKNVTVGAPWKYATDSKYVSLVMSKIDKYRLTELDCVIV